MTDKLREAAEYILDGMGIDGPDYTVDPHDEYLDAANSKWVKETLSRLAAALAAAPQPEVIGRADNMPLADMARAEAFRTLARCIRDPSQPRKMGLPDLAGVLAWEERRIAALDAPQPAPMDREALVEVIRDALRVWHDPDRISPPLSEAIADALLARGQRLPGGEETMAWAAKVILTQPKRPGSLVADAFTSACAYLEDRECGAETTNEIIETFLKTLDAESN